MAIKFPTDTVGKTPVGADLIPLADSAASNAFKETTVTDLSTASFGLKTTTDLAEGTNEYYTEAKVTANTSVAANTAKLTCDTTNVTAAGALMDSEVDADIKTLSLPANTTISAFGATVVDDADAATARTTLGVAIGSDVQAYDANNATASSTTTLTNKTIDGDSNTISNLDIGNEVDWAAANDVSDASAFASGDKVLIYEDGVGMRKVDYDDLPAGGGGSSPLTTKGDVYTYDTADARLGIGANGQVLTADSAQATGLKWASPAGGGDMTTATYDPASIAEQLVGLTAAQTLTNKTLTSPDINGGTIDGATIGATTPSTGVFEGSGSLTALEVSQSGTGTSLNIPNLGTGDFIVVNTSDFVVDNAGNVGIGIANPAQSLDLVAGTSLGFGGTAILADTAGTTTLSNIDAIDATTETTLETAIDSLSNLTTVGTITTGVWNGTDIAVADGGTGASDTATARTNLGVAIGTDVQAWDSHLDDIAGLTPASKLIIGDGLGGWTSVTPANFITDNNILDTADIGSSVQAYDNDLVDIAALTHTKGNVMVSNGTDWINVGVGTNDQVLTADSAQTAGVKWADAGGGGGSSSAPQFTVNVDGVQIVGELYTYIVNSTVTAGTFRASLGVLPTGADFIIKLYKNGTEDASVTIATTDTATNGLYQGTDTSFVSGSYVAGDVITVEVTQVGSTIAGADLTFSLFE